MKPKRALGLLLAFVLILVLWPKRTETQDFSKPPSPPSYPGRFQIIINPSARIDTFLLDTETGDTWVQTVIPNATGSPTIWLYRERIVDKANFQFEGR